MIAKGRLEGGINGEAAKRADGKTPLILAVEAGQMDVIDYLLTHGADISLKDAAGDTAVDIAGRQKDPAAASRLAAYEAQHPGSASYYATVTPTLSILSGSDQTGAPDGGGSQSLVVSVTDQSGKELADAPVDFSVVGGGKNLLTTATSPDSPSLLLRTGPDGIAKANVHLPKTAGQQIRITAGAGLPGHLSQVTFTATAVKGRPSAETESVYSPSHVEAILNPDASMDVSWVNNTDDETAIKVWVRGPGKWTLAATLPPHTTSAHIPPP